MENRSNNIEETMDAVEDRAEETRRIFSKINALSCIRILIVAEIVIKILKIIIIGTVLYAERNKHHTEQQLHFFLIIYSFLTFFKIITFYQKNKSFFTITSIPDFEENVDVALINNILEATMLFWYIIGFHCIQECVNCKEKQPLLYYTSLTVVCLGFFAFIAPLLAIVILLFLISYIKPKLTTVIYTGNGSDLPNETRHCTICYDEYQEGALIKILPCDHHFHSDCIDEWISIKENCPLCKKNVNVLFDIVDGQEISSNV